MLAERIGATQLADMSAQAMSLASSSCAGDLPRLAELVAPGTHRQDSALTVDVGFENGPEGMPVVAIGVQGVVQLQCQRCLAPVAWPIAVQARLTAVGAEADADDLADPFDSVLLEDDGALALRVAIEDEILATLPLAPVHPNRADCAAVPAVHAVAAEQAEITTARTTRPFAGLDALFARRADQDDQE